MAPTFKKNCISPSLTSPSSPSLFFSKCRPPADNDYLLHSRWSGETCNHEKRRGRVISLVPLQNISRFFNVADVMFVQKPTPTTTPPPKSLEAEIILDPQCLKPYKSMYYWSCPAVINSPVNCTLFYLFITSCELKPCPLRVLSHLKFELHSCTIHTFFQSELVTRIQ